MNKNTITGQKISEAVFLAAFSCLLILQYLEGTTFVLDAPDFCYVIFRSVLLCVGLYRALEGKNLVSKPTLLTLGAFLGLGIYFLISRGDYFIFDMSVVMLGAIGVPFKRIGGLYVFIGIFISVLAFVCSKLGVIPDYVFYSQIGSKTITRHSFGIIYPTDFFAHFFYLCIVYFILRWKRITYWEIGIISGLGVILFIFTGARADFLCLAMVVAGALICKICKYKEIKIKDRYKALIGALLMPVGAIFIIVLTWLYKPYHPVYSKIDSMMTQRLSLGRLGFDLYGFTPLGASNFAENGNANGGITKYEYVFYDSSYIKMLFKYGIIVLALVLVIYALISIKLTSSKMFYAIVFISAIALSCIIEHHIFELPYNLSFLLLTSDVSSCLQSTPIINNNKRKML